MRPLFYYYYLNSSRLCCHALTFSTPWIAESISVSDIKYLVPNTDFSISITDMQNGSCHGPRETKIPHNNTTTTTSGAIILSGGVAAASSATATAAVAAANGSVTVRYLPLQCCTDWDCSSSNTLEDVWQSSPPLIFYCGINYQAPIYHN